MPPNICGTNPPPIVFGIIMPGIIICYGAMPPPIMPGIIICGAMPPPIMPGIIICGAANPLMKFGAKPCPGMIVARV